MYFKPKIPLQMPNSYIQLTKHVHLNVYIHTKLNVAKIEVDLP